MSKMDFNKMIEDGLDLFNKGDYKQAEEQYKDSLALCIINMAKGYNRLGFVNQRTGKMDVSEQYFKKAINMLADNKYKNEDFYKVELAYSYIGMGNVYREGNEYDLAIDIFTDALLLRSEVFGKSHKDVAMVHALLGEVYSSKGNKHKAFLYYCNAIKILEDCKMSYEMMAAIIYNNFGNLCMDIDRKVDAKLLYKKSLDIYNNLYPNHPEKSITQSNYDGLRDL
jgi:tetratricopeptide (TPR) repeat protein